MPGANKGRRHVVYGATAWRRPRHKNWQMCRADEPPPPAQRDLLKAGASLKIFAPDNPGPASSIHTSAHQRFALISQRQCSVFKERRKWEPFGDIIQRQSHTK